MNYNFNLLSQIEYSKHLLSPAEVVLADFILGNSQAAQNLSIKELALESGVSLATVSRFCRHMSLDGYQEFKMELARSLAMAEQPSPGQFDVTSEDTLTEVASKVADIHHQALSSAIKCLDLTALSRICDLIDEADDVHFIGSGDMLLLAMSAMLQFMYISTKFHCNFDPSIQALSTCLMTSRSLVIILSFTGEVSIPVELAKMAKAHQASVVVISRYSKSSLVKYADLSLVCGVPKGIYQYSSLPLHTGYHYIIDLIYTEYCRRHPDIAEENREKTAGIAMKKYKDVPQK